MLPLLFTPVSSVKNIPFEIGIGHYPSQYVLKNWMIGLQSTVVL